MDQDRGVPLFEMSAAARQAGLSAPTLRSYEAERLLLPARRGLRRLFSEQDLIWLRCISELIHGHSLTTAAIRRLLDLIPCWEVKHCPDEVAARCAPHLNIPDMAVRAPARSPAPEDDAVPDQLEGPAVEVKIFYGVREFGAMLPCMKCIQTERIARRVAERHPGRVVVRKFDALSSEAHRYGIIMTPTVIVDDEVVVSGRSLSGPRLEQLLERHLDET
jgi:DNA-binding transcriptional MerR regulator